MENDLFNIFASEGASSDAHSLKTQGGDIVTPRGLVRLEFQKEASYFINTTIDIFEFLDNNVIWGRKITIIFDGKHTGQYRGRLSQQHCRFLMKQDC